VSSHKFGCVAMQSVSHACFLAVLLSVVTTADTAGVQPKPTARRMKPKPNDFLGKFLFGNQKHIHSAAKRQTSAPNKVPLSALSSNSYLSSVGWQSTDVPLPQDNIYMDRLDGREPPTPSVESQVHEAGSGNQYLDSILPRYLGAA